MSLRPIMSKELTSLPPHASVLDGAKFMHEMGVGCVVVTGDDDKPLGIVTDRDIMSKVIIDEKDPKTVKLKDIMTSPAVSIKEDKHVFDVTKLMSVHGVRRFPVVDSEGKLIGVIALDDLLILLGREMHEIAAALKIELHKD